MTPSRNQKYPGRLLWPGYSLLLVYGSWFPLGTWDWSLGGLAAAYSAGWPNHFPRTDVVLNVLVYLPFGFLAAARLKGSITRRLLLATSAGALLSAALEFGQTYLPGRVTSVLDIVLNTAGSLGGGAMALVLPRLRLSRHVYQSLHRSLRYPGAGELGLVALCLWVVSQWAPLVPSLDPGNLKAGLAPLKASLAGGTSFEWARFTSYLLMFFGTGAIALAVVRPGRVHTRWIASSLLLVLAGKVVMIDRVLATEALLAGCCTVACLALLQRLRLSGLRLLAFIALATFYTHYTLLPSPSDTTLRTINWVPFRGHINSEYGIFNLLDLAWVFTGLAFALSGPGRQSRRIRALQGTLLLTWVALLEWYQQFIPGRYPDITDVVVAMGIWWLASGFPRPAGGATGVRDKRALPLVVNARGATQRPLAVLLACLLLAATAYIFYRGTSDAPPAYSLPDIDQLPAPVFTGFRAAHPRLRPPGTAEIRRIRDLNPGFWIRHREAALEGELYSRILMARVEPGSVDTAELHGELMKLEPSGRGQEQTSMLALGYDWLYGEWNPAQRQALLDKVARACRYQVEVIRNKYSLSPYNVYLYNRPLQALLMAALASHGDASDDSCMRFTADYWKNRVLPVWRQVMGENGGWHEGGEYVGIGIGQAIYQLPAMWRYATGEDLFATEPGIRGFLDFAVYRTRPDGTQMRLGDTAFFNRDIPDLAALAVEYHHSAAYTLAKTPARPEPLTRPWGPLPQPALTDPGALDKLPLFRYFDGIGLLIARSSWKNDATWVSFKAGNNYWSHSHLDQGAFTIFKGGALAIDSGLYGTAYGSDHHLNYTYQSIAHNVITVTDPDDRQPMPPLREGATQRHIANDGGQRRVGSGWGRPAPRDRVQWLREQDHYRTVGKSLRGEDHGVVWMVADLTPAYTNLGSGKGDFAERSKRVDHYQRSFAFISSIEIVIVYDRVESADPAYRKRWLLHSQNAPQINADSFELGVSHNPATGMPGGRLMGRVLLPENAGIAATGGPGFEFFVDGTNYDEDGAVQLAAARHKGAEPGSWRLEVQPGSQNRQDEFLVVMQATGPNSRDALPRLRLQANRDNLLLTVGDDAPYVITIPRAIEPVVVTRP